MFDKLKVWRSGEIINWREANVHLMSHGFSRASAIFDVFGIHPTDMGLMAFRMDKHFERLFRTAQLLGMEMKYSEEELKKAVTDIVHANNIRRGLIKILAYFSEEAVINLVLDSKLDVAIFGIPEDEELGLDSIKPISVCFSSWRKIHPSTVPVEAKACSNYLNGMLARRDAVKRGFDVGILLTVDGYVAEGSIESFFMVKNGILYTSKTGNILRSITRMSVMDVAKSLGIEVVEKDIMPVEFMEADEIFASHTGAKIQPVNKIEYRIIENYPGDVTKKLLRTMDNILHLKYDRFKDWMQPIN